MSASWTPCTPEYVVVGDAVSIGGRDPSGDVWTLSGRVRQRGDNGTCIVEWTARSGIGDPPYPLWSNQIVRRDRLISGGLRRHPDHGPAERTDDAGRAFLRSLVAGADVARLAACVKPGVGGMHVGVEAAERILAGRDLAHEWMLRQLDGRMSAEDAKAYVPVVQASRTAVPEAAVEVRRPAGPRVLESDAVYSDPDVREVLEALPGAYVSTVRQRSQESVEAVEVGGG